MGKVVLSEREKFERKMKNLEPNAKYVYFTGILAHTRAYRPDVDYIARFVMACFELGYARLHSIRNNNDPKEWDYVIVLNEKLGMRVDGNGRFQEAQRVASLIG